MYGWLWRKLPGRWWLKTIESLVLVAAIVALLMFVVFPWLEPQLPWVANTVDSGVPTESVTPTTTPSGGASTPVPRPTGLTGE